MANTSSNNILDLINEKATNIEIISTAQSIKTSLNEAIKQLGKKESQLRESTITISHSEQLPPNKIMEIIESNWVEKLQQLPVTYWQDKSKFYVQFISSVTKMDFLNTVNEVSNFFVIKNAIDPLNEEGYHISRKPVKLEINQVRGNIHAKKINDILQGLNTSKVKISDIREGKPHAITKSRSLMFTANSEGLKVLLDQLEGAIQYNNLATNTRAKLYFKINCKPYQCRDCFAIGRHDNCPGKICGQCGQKDHAMKDCKQKTRYCNNCHKKGHKTKDIHCPIYINEIIKELRRMDIPTEYMENKELRQTLIKQLQLK